MAWEAVATVLAGLMEKDGRVELAGKELGGVVAFRWVSAGMVWRRPGLRSRVPVEMVRTAAMWLIERCYREPVWVRKHAGNRLTLSSPETG
ncbi:MAG: hypothetical protein HS115_03195 [Spirochaetales bacterium]|nr:hypothetical protein [Spirochaetales bacterium]